MKNLHQLFRLGGKFADDNAPLILTAIGAVGSVTTAYLAGKASFEAAEVLREAELEKVALHPADAVVEPPTLTKKEVFDKVWKLYIPAAASICLTVGAIVASNRVSTRRAAAVAAAYTALDQNFNEYREKALEKLGKNKEELMRGEIAQERVSSTMPGEDSAIWVTDEGEVPCFDVFTGRYFKSSMEEIKAAQNHVNHKIIHSQYASLNDFYSWLGLDNIPLGEELGWQSSEPLEISFATVMGPKNKPCISFDFRTEPLRDYSRFHQ
jgi:hypothetical protein